MKLKFFAAIVLSILTSDFALARTLSVSPREPQRPQGGNVPKSFDIDFGTGQGMNIGRGYDSFRDDSVGVCVRVPEVTYDEDRTPNTIQQSVFKLDLIESKEDLSKKLGVTIAASLKSGFSKGSMTASYLNEQKMSRYSIYILTSAEILLAPQTAKNEDLDAFYVDLATSHTKSFREKCGNEYVASIKRGGVFYGLLKLDTEDQSSYTQMKAALRAKVGTFKAAADFERAITEAVSKRSLQIYTLNIGGQAKAYPTNAEELIDRVKNFPAEVVSHPIVIRAITAPYTNLKSYPIQATPFETAHQEAVLESLGRMRFKLLNEKDDIDYITSNKWQFDSFTESDLYNRIDYLNEKLNQIYVVTKSCLSNFNHCQFPQLNLVGFVLPQRKNQDVQLGKCELKADRACGIIYKTLSSPACSPQAFILGRAAVCGVEKYQVARTEACGVEAWNEKEDPVCGPALFNERNDGYTCGWEDDCSMAYLKPIQNLPFRLGGGGGGRGCKRVAKTCRHQNFGVARYNSCAHSNFGVKAFKSCEHSSHGPAVFKECRHESFGIEEYSSCQHISHGEEGIRQCHIQSVMDSQTGVVKSQPCLP